MSRNRAVKADIPTRAKAVFREMESQVRSPETVPTAGPMVRVVKK